VASHPPSATPGRPGGLSRQELVERVASIPWYHAIDLGQGVVTPGSPPNPRLLAEGLPDFAGKSVLDIGAWDGQFSFLAERRGARRVVALDHYAWCVDFAARHEYWRQCAQAGVLPDHRRDLTDFWRSDEMPGRAGFDLARQVLGSQVEPVVGDFMELGPAELGRFDVVLFLGVLYHLREPLSALERVRELTQELAVIETEAIAVVGMPRARLLEFYPGDEFRGDHTNWFVPTADALVAMCRAAGFARAEVKVGPPAQLAQARALLRRLARGRAGDEPAQAGLQRYRVVVHALVS
jgi:tRNA (mo5U34)-methyltransferase